MRKQEPKAKKPQKPSPKFAGKSCEICGREYLPHPKTGKYPRFLFHHAKYSSPEDPTEVKVVVCLSCHNWMHGNGMVYGHALKPRNMTDAEKALGPFLFAVAVVRLYDEKLFLPAILKAKEEQRLAVVGAYAKETQH